MRPALARIDLDALRHNYSLARQRSGSRALAVIKADAYGHGASRCARALAPLADGFAVACIEEALELRQAGIRAPILLLEGFFEASELDLIAHHDLWTAIASDWQLQALLRARPQRPIHAWLLLDSGMHRLGFAPQDYPAACAKLRACDQVASITLMTHMARADELDSPRTEEQLQCFRRAAKELRLPVSISNSAAVLGWSKITNDWARPGLMLYGASPFSATAGVTAAQTLQPVMTLQSRISATRTLAIGEPIGYGGRFVTHRPTRVGVVALGYADGYPQFAADGTPVYVLGRRTALIGRVSMDMLTVDLTDLPEAEIDSPVELWGAQLPVTEVATHCHSSAYELLCGVKRARRVYVEESP